MFRERMRVGAGLLLLGTLLAACATKTVNVSRSTETAPHTAQDVALAHFGARFDGDVSEVYASATVTLADWRKAEPNNTSGIAESDEEGEALHVVFIRGQFTPALGLAPAGSNPESPTVYDAARLIFDDEGNLLGAEVWNAPDRGPPFSTGDPPIDGAFED